MKIYREESLRNFEAWSGAEDTIKELTGEQMEELEFIIEDAYPDGIDETELNDILWFETDWIAEVLGFASWEELEEHNEMEKRLTK